MKSSEIESRLISILETVVDGIICIDSTGKIDLFNSAAAEMFGYRSEDVLGKNVNILMPEPYASKHDGYISRYEETGEKKIIGIGREVIAKRSNGQIFPIELAVSEVEINGKRLYTGIIRDITRKKEAEEKLQRYKDHLEELVDLKTRELTDANRKLEKLVNIDGLTCIANRRCFDTVLEREIRRATRNKTEISLILCDIDYFKLYNDCYGHTKGDECLKKIAGCLTNVFKRITDLPARYGGEEFAIILPDTGSEEATRIAKELQKKIEKLGIEHVQSTVSGYVTLSMGISTAKPDRNIASSDLINTADEALYKAKKNGRNRIEIYQ